MENKIESYESAVELIEEDPFGRDQASIYLSIDWENETVDVITKYNDNSTPIDVYHGLRALIQLPGSIDAREIRSDVDNLMNRINRIADGYGSQWDGQNIVGYFTAEAEEEYDKLVFDIQNELEGELFSRIPYEGGLWDAADWFLDQEVEPDATDDDLIRLAGELYDEAQMDDNVVIRGGTEAILSYLKDLRGEVDEE